LKFKCKLKYNKIEKNEPAELKVYLLNDYTQCQGNMFVFTGKNREFAMKNGTILHFSDTGNLEIVPWVEYLYSCFVRDISFIVITGENDCCQWKKEYLNKP